MKNWEIDLEGQHIRAQWNESATFFLQQPAGGQWVDYHCFTVYGIESEQEAFDCVMELLQEQLNEEA